MDRYFIEGGKYREGEGFVPDGGLTTLFVNGCLEYFSTVFNLNKRIHFAEYISGSVQIGVNDFNI